MIPNLNNNGELPSGEHQATLDEIEERYGLSSVRRKKLIQGLRDAVQNFEESGVKTLWINGSFITGKNEPNDIDGCWEYHAGVDLNKLDPVFISAAGRDAMKNKYGLDFFIANYVEMGSGLPFPKFFQKNRDGDPKGIIVIKLGGVL
ncbi:TPA: DUF6932 family protein [Legionella pneumophila]|uniref:DUF6932 family protein n=1 Tax=Legionella pneumophila TaxID=446 RepID=UPI0011E019AA|nr:hypothetical protein [Legionella pneumophila]HAT8606298.1 hypothetical protein [Legionella pneumophila]